MCYYHTPRGFTAVELSYAGGPQYNISQFSVDDFFNIIKNNSTNQFDMETSSEGMSS